MKKLLSVIAALAVAYGGELVLGSYKDSGEVLKWSDKRLVIKHKRWQHIDGLDTFRKGKASCGSTIFIKKHINDYDPMVNLAHYLAMQLTNGWENYCYTDRDKPILVTTLVNIHDFNKTSNFGRMVSEALMSALSKLRLRVLDYRLRQNLGLSPKKGEFVLTRDVAKIRKIVPKGYILTGTYGVSGKRLVVEARLVDIDTGEIVATAEAVARDRSLVKMACNDSLCGTPNYIKIVAE